jgi:hypothetical protein
MKLHFSVFLTQQLHQSVLVIVTFGASVLKVVVLWYYLLFIPRNALIYITILNHITNSPTCLSATAPPSGNFDIVFAKVIKYFILVWFVFVLQWITEYCVSRYKSVLRSFASRRVMAFTVLIINSWMKCFSGVSRL